MKGRNDMESNELADITTYYVFTLGTELYALDKNLLKEIKVCYCDQVLSVSNMDSSVLDFMDSCGKTVPVIDLGRKLGIRETQKRSSEKTIVFFEIEINEQKAIHGLVVDTGLGFTNARKQDIKSPPLCATETTGCFISNKFSNRKELIQILDPHSFPAENHQ